MSRYPFQHPTQDLHQRSLRKSSSNNSIGTHFQEGHHRPENADWNQSRDPKVNFSLSCRLPDTQAGKGGTEDQAGKKNERDKYTNSDSNQVATRTMQISLLPFALPSPSFFFLSGFLLPIEPFSPSLSSAPSNNHNRKKKLIRQLSFSHSQFHSGVDPINRLCQLICQLVVLSRPCLPQ